VRTESRSGRRGCSSNQRHTGSRSERIRHRLVAEGTAVGTEGIVIPSGLKGLPALKGLDVELGLKGFALNSPRSSTWTECGSGSSNRRGKTTCMAILRRGEQPLRSGYSPAGEERKRAEKALCYLSECKIEMLDRIQFGLPKTDHLSFQRRTLSRSICGQFPR
jgi:hypothetical protein